MSTPTSGVGFVNGVTTSWNADFTGSSSSSINNGLISNNQVWMGQTTPNANNSHVFVKTITAGNNISFTVTDSVFTISGTNSPKSLIISRQVFTVTGTYTPSVGMVYCDVEVVGGGGGSGGCGATDATTVSATGGGGAGGYCRKILSSAAIGGSQAVTIGAKGNKGSAGNNPGTDGGTTSFGAILSATGGKGTGGQSNATQVNATGGAAGVGSGGDFNTSGGAGGQGFATFFGPTLDILTNGYGGQVFWGGSAIGNAASYGAGGIGSTLTKSSSATAGSDGFAGICIVTEYIFN